MKNSDGGSEAKSSKATVEEGSSKSEEIEEPETRLKVEEVEGQTEGLTKEMKNED